MLPRPHPYFAVGGIIFSVYILVEKKKHLYHHSLMEKFPTGNQKSGSIAISNSKTLNPKYQLRRPEGTVRACSSETPPTIFPSTHKVISISPQIGLT